MTTSDLIQRLENALTRTGSASTDFDLNTDVVLPQGRVLTPAAVMIAVRVETARLILTKRSPRLKHHPGQIAFPGGKLDPSDVDLTAAALRETQEEIGLDPKQLRILGAMPAHETVTSYQITPVIGVVQGAFVARPEAGEVSEVFEVPLEHVIRPQNFITQSRRWQGRQRLYYTVPYGPYYIWGATARILRALAERMSP